MLDQARPRIAAIDAQVQQSVAVIGVVEDLQADGVAGDVADDKSAAFEDSMSMVTLKRMVPPESPPDRPEVIEMVDVPGDCPSA